MATPRPAGRPRDPDLDVAIRTAALELIGEGGLDACALDEVARRAGVGKATIYRRWDGKDALVLDAMTHTPPASVPTADEGGLEADARALLLGVLRATRTPLARAARQLMPLLATRPDLAAVHRSTVTEAWEAAVDGVVTRAVARGEVAPGAFPSLALRAAVETLTHRWLVHRDPDAALVEDLLAVLVRPHLPAR